jgi:hypothetical protein
MVACSKLQWKLAQDQAADLNYVVHRQFAGDLEVMGGGTSINIRSGQVAMSSDG